MSVIGERNAEILGPQFKLIAQGRSRELDVLPEVGNRDRVSIKTINETRAPAIARSGFPRSLCLNCSSQKEARQQGAVELMRQELAPPGMRLLGFYTWMRRG